MNGTTSYALSKRYVAETAESLGSLKGAPCEIVGIDDIVDGEGNVIGNRVTFQWEGTSGTIQTETMDVMNGENTGGSLPAGGTISQQLVKQSSEDGDALWETVQETMTYAQYQSLTPSQKNDGTIRFVPDAPGGGGGGGGSAELSNDLNVTETVGGVTAGKTYYAETPLETIFRDMLDPVKYPTLTNPSATLTATGAKLLEVGDTLETTMTVTFSRGAITPAYGTSGYRSGAASGYSLNGGTEQMENTFTETITSAQLTYRAAVSYLEGEQPKDSSGNDYSTPLAAGSVNSNTITYEFVNALWANTANIGTVAKLALVSKSAKAKEFVFPSATAANPEIFDVPASWTVTAVQVKNTLNNQWEDCSAQFTVTDTTHDDAAGDSTAYKRYTCNLGYDMGTRNIKVSWS